jgi:hypothetical protein
MSSPQSRSDAQTLVQKLTPPEEPHVPLAHSPELVQVSPRAFVFGAGAGCGWGCEPLSRTHAPVEAPETGMQV